MEETRKKTNRRCTESPDNLSESGSTKGRQVEERRRISFRELAKHPYLLIDPRRLSLAIKATDVMQLLVGQYDRDKQPDQI